ncbi:MAG: SnoaL-like domain [Acidobacteriota bacterium]|jgi:ketosteroid isomerase-like protein|nr:SnoaL-like domain [Acidobacteriota bacterium]
MCEMEHRERETIVSPTEPTVPLDVERTIASPRFDEKSIQHAQPAVPLTLRRKARSWPLAAIILCVVGGIVGGVLGGLAITFFQRDRPHTATSTAPVRQDSGDANAGANVGASVPTEAGNVSTSTSNAPQSASQEQKASTVGGGVQSDAPNTGNTGAQKADGQSKTTADGRSTTTDAARNPASPADGEGATDSAAVEADRGTQDELRAALGEWLAATNSRDVRRQMQFYAPTVDAFYLSRNASREAVRAEKSRVFARADSVNVQAAAPEIRLSRDGHTAVMRFRKRYQIDGGEGSRSGEVLQELRWRRTPAGWKIVSERDLRVIQ